MVLEKADEDRVLLVAGDLFMEQEENMNLFYITEHRLVNISHPRRGISMEIKFKRKIMSEMMTTYLPSMLLMMITFATTFFKPIFFEAALSVNLTTMLVMTTIFISKMESLPPTSATKMIDYWLILCQLVPFAQVVLLTMKENLREEEQEENLALEKDITREPLATKDGSKIKVEDGTNPKEAWTFSEIKLSKTGSLTMLTMTGNILISFLISYRTALSEKKVLPLTVLIASIVYFAIAASFYFE